MCQAAGVRKNGMFLHSIWVWYRIYPFIIVVKSRETLSQESVNPGLEAKERNTKPTLNNLK